MTTSDKEAGLSARAKKTLQLMREGKWYPWAGPIDMYPPKPDCLRELIDAGLVTDMMRVNEIVRCWVPTGTIHFVPEQFPPLPGQTDKYPTPTKTGFYWARGNSSIHDPDRWIVVEVVIIGNCAAALSPGSYIRFNMLAFVWGPPVHPFQGF